MMIHQIFWNPNEIILDLGFYQLAWYSLFFLIAFVSSYFILKKHFQKAGLQDEQLGRLIMYVIFATIIGARLGHCFFYDWDYYSDHLLEIILPFTFDPRFEFVGFRGLASHGGGIAVILVLIIFARKEQIDLWWLLDKMALVVPLAGACIRLGNLMNSEIIGKPADVPWAFIFAKVDMIPRHPGQLYEAIFYLVLFFFLQYFDKVNRHKKGFLFGLYLVCTFIARFFIEFLKIDQSDFEADLLLNMGQLLSIPFILLGIGIMVLKNTSGQVQKPLAELMD
ncbi:prolipoprotein diacylglyceryl transferase [Pararhodonellum marinum]|uniref:prolipoprotein diacylglyceryl transferase n=1 Tax=Pararhodonellum marinum TaxID=2755358 RepID=UPI001E323F0E|nr:prolipoprotein diacylglyceryl transferase [Pararhodonellum marinum]